MNHQRQQANKSRVNYNSNNPEEFHRLTNWEKLANDSTDEEEGSRKQKAAIKATVQW